MKGKKLIGLSKVELKSNDTNADIKTSKRIKLKQISESERAQIRIPTYSYILP